MRAEPVAALQKSGCLVMRMPQRPDQDQVVLKEFATLKEAQDFFSDMAKQLN